jgi:hypothetical protein
MFSVGDNEFSYKNAIIKNTAEKTNYLPKVGYMIDFFGYLVIVNKSFSASWHSGFGSVAVDGRMHDSADN